MESVNLLKYFSKVKIDVDKIKWYSSKKLPQTVICYLKFFSVDKKDERKK